MKRLSFFWNRFLLTIGIASTIAQGAASAQQPRYKARLLSIPGSVSSEPKGINENGDVIVNAAFPGAGGAWTYHGFLFQHGQGVATDLGMDGVACINNRGWIVCGVGQSRFLYRDGQFVPLPDLTIVYDLNDSNQILGSYPDSYLPKPGRLDGGILRPLTMPAGSQYGYGMGINDSGVSCGFVGDPHGDTIPVLWDPMGAAQLLPKMHSGLRNRANAINQNGLVVGYATTASGSSQVPERQSGAAWRGGSLHILAPLPGYTNSGALAVNNDGDIVGWSAFNLAGGSGGFDARATIWTRGGSRDLNALIQPGFPYILIEAKGINDRGVICAWGQEPSTLKRVAVLLEPGN